MAVVGAAEEGFMGSGCYRVPVCLRQLGGLLGGDGTGLRKEAAHQGGHVCMCGHVWVPNCDGPVCWLVWQTGPFPTLLTGYQVQWGWKADTSQRE